MVFCGFIKNTGKLQRTPGKLGFNYCDSKISAAKIIFKNILNLKKPSNCVSSEKGDPLILLVAGNWEET